jgi:hypothetical protein
MLTNGQLSASSTQAMAGFIPGSHDLRPADRAVSVPGTAVVTQHADGRGSGRVIGL